MPSTRSTARPTTTSPLVEDERSQRLRRQLDIDGTAALRGCKTNQKPVAVRKYGGASYAVDPDGISWAKTGSKKRPATVELASPPPASKRRRRQSQPEGLPENTISVSKGKKRKLDDGRTSTDGDFLLETIQQVKRVKVPTDSTRAADLQELMPYLQKMKSPCRQHTLRRAPEVAQPLRDAPEAYDLDAREAKRLFTSTNRIDAPVFVAKGAPSEIVDLENDPRRPIEQVLDWLPDLDETDIIADKEVPRASAGAVQQVTVSEIRERFINEPGYHPFPWNFPEIPFPMPVRELPGFLRHTSCNFLNDIIRYVQDVNVEQICPATCENQGITADRCQVHFQTADELVEVQRAVKLWLGTIMMAEAGAYTHEHCDTPGFGTLISCYEGEIGFAYQQKSAKSSSKWLYKILRPGDAVYMGPATRHLVFRQPEGSQTLATAVRILRSCDVVEWLKALSAEFDTGDDSRESQLFFSRVVRALVIGARHFVEQAKAHSKFEKFGGPQNLKEAEKLLRKIEKQRQTLLTRLSK